MRPALERQKEPAEAEKGRSRKRPETPKARYTPRLSSRRSLGARISRYNYGTVAPSQKLSDSAQEEEKLRKLYDQARQQGNKKKKKEYKEKIAELNRLRKADQRESNKQKS